MGHPVAVSSQHTVLEVGVLAVFPVRVATPTVHQVATVTSCSATIGRAEVTPRHACPGWFWVGMGYKSPKGGSLEH